MVDPSGCKALPWWAKLLIGVSFVVAGAAVTALTAGTGTGFVAAFGAALMTSMKAVAVSTAISASIGMVVAGISTGTVDGAINGLIDGAVDGVMWGGIFAGGAQILSGGFKIAAKLGVKTGIKGGIKISKHVKILSPNHLKHYEGGGTLIKIGNLARKGKNIRIDVGAESLLHLNIQFRKNFHILFGKYLSGIIGGFYEWEI